MKTSIQAAALILLPSAVFRRLVPGTFFFEVHLSRAVEFFYPSEFVCGNTCNQTAARIKQELSILPRRRLSADELSEFRRDGVAVIRSVISDQKMINTLHDELWKVANKGLRVGDELRMKASSWNAGVRALIDDDLVSTLAFSASNATQDDEFKLEEYPVWGTNATPEQRFDTFHYDDQHPLSKDGKCSMVTIWLSLTESFEPLDFIKGSNRKRKDIMSSECAIWNINRIIPTSFALYERDCVQKLMEDGGYPASRFSATLKPGDAFVFNGDMLHATTYQLTGRLGIAFRFRPFPPGDGCQSGLPEMWVPPGVVPIDKTDG